MGAQKFAGQYMQNPTPLGGGEFKEKFIQFYDSRSPNFSVRGNNIYIMYDPAFAKKKSKGHDPDYTAIMVWALAPDENYYLVDMVRDRLNLTERADALFDVVKKWQSKSSNKPKVIAESYGMESDEHYMKKRMEEENYRFPLVLLPRSKMHKTDKIRRLIPLWEAYRIFLPEKLLYKTIDGNVVELVRTLLEEEINVFPVGVHDDMWDAASQICDPEAGAKFPATNRTYGDDPGHYGFHRQHEYVNDDHFLNW